MFPQSRIQYILTLQDLPMSIHWSTLPPFTSCSCHFCPALCLSILLNCSCVCLLSVHFTTRSAWSFFRRASWASRSFMCSCAPAYYWLLMILCWYSRTTLVDIDENDISGQNLLVLSLSLSLPPSFLPSLPLSLAPSLPSSFHPSLLLSPPLLLIDRERLQNVAIIRSNVREIIGVSEWVWS